MFAVLFSGEVVVHAAHRLGMGSWGWDTYPRCGVVPGFSPGSVTAPHLWRPVGAVLAELVEWRCARCGAVALGDPTLGEAAQGIDHHGD